MSQSETAGLTRGTRAGGTPVKLGLAWERKEFAGHFKEGNLSPESALRKITNWINGANPPKDIRPIEHLLFGKIAVGGPDPYAVWRADLRHAHNRPEQVEPKLNPIPRVPSHFLGRDKDVATILGVLLSAPTSASVAILVQGGPGIGKTTLTKAIGRHPDVIRRFGERDRWFVELDTIKSATTMQDAIARAIGADPTRGFEATLTQLRQRPGLLVLDNLETPWDPTIERSLTEDVLATLADIPSLALLASFRGGDRIGGPTWALVHPVTQLDPPYDVELFCRIANAPFSHDRHMPSFMAALGGIPLAIELVASRAHGRTSLAALWAQWDRVGAALAVSPDFDAGRLTSLPHSIEVIADIQQVYRACSPLVPVA